MKTKQLDPRDGELATLRWLVKTLATTLAEQHDQVMIEEGIEIKDGVHFRQGVQITNACDVCSLITQINRVDISS